MLTEYSAFHEDDAIDQSNIMGGDSTRRAMPQFERQYSEGSDDDDMLDAEWTLCELFYA